MSDVPQGVQLQLSSELGSWQIFALELILTFLVVLAYLVTVAAHPLERQAVSPLFVGGAHLACTLLAAPTLNPARGLGPAFVMNKWNDLWIYLFGPLSGGMLCGLIYQFIFNPFRSSKKANQLTDEDISSIHSEEEPYDDVDSPSSGKFKVSTYNSLRPSDSGRPLSLDPGEKSNTASPDGTTKNYCSNITTSALYSALPCKPDPVEPLYCGTKSLHSKSPLPARSGLNRSQSVYSKVPSSNRDQDGLPRPGPLVPAQSLYPMPAQSLYPMRFNQNPITTQNIQNQQNQHSESIYGVRGVSNSVNRGQTGGVYSVIHGNTSGMNNTSLKLVTGLGGGPSSGSNSSSSNRPESMYGAASRRHDSTDSTHGPCQAGNAGNSFALRTLGSGGSYFSRSKTCAGTRKELHSPKGQHQLLSPAAVSVISTTNTLASYHHKRSPNHQY